MAKTLYKNGIKNLNIKNKYIENFGILVRTFLISGSFFAILVLFKILHTIGSSLLNISINPFNEKFQKNIIFLIKMSNLFILYSLVIETVFFFILSRKTGGVIGKFTNYISEYAIHIILFLGIYFYLKFIDSNSESSAGAGDGTDAGADAGADDSLNNNIFIKLLNIIILIIVSIFIFLLLLFIAFSIKDDKHYSYGYSNGKKYVINEIKKLFNF